MNNVNNSHQLFSNITNAFDQISFNQNLDSQIVALKDTFEKIKQFDQELSDASAKGLILDTLANHSTMRATTLEEMKGPPIPPIRMSKLDEASHIQGLVTLFESQKGSLSVGPSLLIDLFADHIFAAYRACLKENTPALQLLYRLTLEGNPNTIYKGKELFTHLNATLFRMMGLLLGSINQYPILFAPLTLRCNKDLSFQTTQKLILEHWEHLILNINLLKLHEAAKPFENWIKLIDNFEETIACHMHLLFQPLVPSNLWNETFTITHFKKLSQRITRLQNLVSECDIYLGPYKLKSAERLNTFERDKAVWLDRWQHLSPLLVEESKLNGQKLKALYLLCQTEENDFIESKGARLIHQLSLALNEIKDRTNVASYTSEQLTTGAQQNHLFLINTSSHLILRECRLIIYNELCRRGLLKKEELKKNVAELISLLTQITDFSLDAIRKEIIQQKELISNPTNLVYLGVIEELEKMAIIYKKQSVAYMDALKFRQTQLDRDSQNDFSLRLAFNDFDLILHTLRHLCEVNSSCIKEKLDLIFPPEQQNEHLLEIRDKVLKLYEMGLSLSANASGSLTEQLDAAFEELIQKDNLAKQEAQNKQTAAMAAADKAMAELIEAESAKKPAKAKGQPPQAKVKPAPKSPPKITTPSPASAPLAKKVIVLRAPIQRGIPEALSDIFRFGTSLKEIPLVSATELALRQKWRDAALSNLQDFQRQLSETLSDHSFNFNKFFGELDTLRRMIEATFEAIIAHYPLVNAEGHSILREKNLHHHELHQHVRLLLSSSLLPKNVIDLLWSLRAIPYALSQANACVNYPYQTVNEPDLSPPGRSLVDFLLKIIEEKRSSGVLERSEWIEEHEKRLKEGLYFCAELLHAVLDVNHKVDPSLFSQEAFSPKMKKQLDQEFIATSRELKNDEEENVLLAPLPPTDKKIKGIQNHEVALAALKEAAIWLQIRAMAPVEGPREGAKRKLYRNQSLNHVRLYLERMSEKLSGNQNGIYNRCPEELRLIRRAHKELALAFLYHSDFYIEGKHIVEAKKLRYENDPCLLNALLRQRSPHIPPFDPWLRRAHAILSYPKKLTGQEDATFEEKALRATLDEVRTISERNEGAAHLIAEQETQKIFPALSALLHMLRYALPAP